MCILFLSAFSFIHYGKENENAEIGYVSAIAAVVKRIFEESGVDDVVVNIRTLDVFKKKISLLQTAYRRASLLNGWKTGLKYQLKIYSNEVAVQKVKTQCEILRGQIKNHSHATHLICIFAKTFVVNFLSSSRTSISYRWLPFLILFLILSFKHWPYSSINLAPPF